MKNSSRLLKSTCPVTRLTRSWRVPSQTPLRFLQHPAYLLKTPLAQNGDTEYDLRNNPHTEHGPRTPVLPSSYSQYSRVPFGLSPLQIRTGTTFPSRGRIVRCAG